MSNGSSIGGKGHRTLAGSAPSPGTGGAFPGFTATIPTINSNEGTAGVAATAQRGDAIPSQFLVAAWTVGLCRVFAVDGINGNDANKGYADPATSSAANYAIASAAAGLVAKQTFAGLAAVLPRFGAGRTFEVQIKGAVYAAGVGTSTTYVGALETFLGGLTGYAANCTVRGTGTNTTAGTTAFDGSAADCAYAGMNTAVGMNSAGYNPTGAPTTTVIQCLKVGGAAPAFGAEPALPVGARIRFDAATSTAALRNISRHISGVSGADTITVPTALPAVPAAADVFYIEEGGVVFGASTLIHDSGGAGTTIGLNLVALKLTGALTLRGGTYTMAGVRATSFSTVLMKGLLFAASYTHPVRSTTTQGQYGRCDGTFTNTNNRQFFDGLTCVGAISSVGPLTQQAIVAFTFGAGLSLTGGVPQAGIAYGNSTANTIRSRIIGPGTEAGLNIQNATLVLNQLDITNMGAKPAVKLEGTVTLQLGGAVGSPVSIGGATGNTDVGMDLTLSRGSMIIIDAAQVPTVTGAVGDVRVSDGSGTAFTGGLIVTWASIIAAGGFVDVAGNTFIVHAQAVGPAQQARRYTRPTEFTGKLTTGLAAVFTYCANGDAPTANMATVWLKPTRKRVAKGLIVTVIGGAVGVVVTVSLYKSTAAGVVGVTAMTTTIVAGQAIRTQSSQFATPVLFDLTDSYVVRADAPIDGILPGDILIAGTIDWA